MNASAKVIERIEDALADLLEREALAARAGSGTRVLAIQERIRPLVEAVSSLAAQSRSPRARESVGRLAEARRQNRLLMQAALGRIRLEIDLKKAALERVRRLSPAYRRGSPVALRLNACT
jgi:hypothetical protein